MGGKVLNLGHGPAPVPGDGWTEGVGNYTWLTCSEKDWIPLFETSPTDTAQTTQEPCVMLLGLPPSNVPIGTPVRVLP